IRGMRGGADVRIHALQEGLQEGHTLALGRIDAQLATAVLGHLGERHIGVVEGTDPARQGVVQLALDRQVLLDFASERRRIHAFAFLVLLFLLFFLVARLVLGFVLVFLLFGLVLALLVGGFLFLLFVVLVLFVVILVLGSRIHGGHHLHQRGAQSLILLDRFLVGSLGVGLVGHGSEFLGVDGENEMVENRDVRPHAPVIDECEMVAADVPLDVVVGLALERARLVLVAAAVSARELFLPVGDEGSHRL